MAGRGRPKKKAAAKRESLVAVRFSESEHADLTALAASLGVSLSAWCRMKILQTFTTTKENK